MKKFTLLLLVSFLSIFFVKAQCTYTLELTDSWGDGWNGNTIDVKAGTVTTNYTVSAAQGTTNSVNITVNTGDSIVLDYLAGGSFNAEVSFELFDPSGISLYSSGTGPFTGVHYRDTAFCPYLFSSK